MGNVINSNEQMIHKINEILQSKKDAVISIVNDKLTTSVFALLEKNLKNVKEINSVKDKHLQKGLETWKANHLDTIINDEIGRRFPEKSEQELEVERLKTEISKMKSEKVCP